MKPNFTVLAVIAAACLSVPLMAQTPQLALTTFSTGYTQPVSIAHAGDDRLFIVEQDGRIMISDASGVRNPTPFLNIVSRINSSGNEQGLLGLAFHPDYTANGHFFVNYTNLSGHTVISRFTVTANPNVADPNSEQILLTINQPQSNHNGGNILFGHDGYLYIGMGDGGGAGDTQNNAQNPQLLLGKMLRINVNQVPYTIPADNPFVSNSSVRDEIWSIGLRNPWRFSFDRHTGDLWIADVGQNAHEEVNFEPNTSQGGLNYGWRCYEGNFSFNTAGCQPQSAYTAPVYDLPHTGNVCSITGGFVYRGGQYGRLYGHYLYTDYCDGIIRSLTPNGSGGFTNTQLLNGLPFQYTAFGEDQHGELYVAGRGNGNIYRITETNCQPTAAIIGPAQAMLCPGNVLVLEAVTGQGLTYQWRQNGSNIPGAQASFLQVNATGTYDVVVTNTANCTATSATVTVVDYSTPTVSISGLDPFIFCHDAPPVTITGNPAGGTFSGQGVTGNVFTPGSALTGSQITYTYTDACGIISATSQNVTVTICDGVAEEAAIRNLQVYPNPAGQQFMLDFSLQQPGLVQAEVLNTLGQVVHRQQLQSHQSGDQRMAVTLPGVASGMYLLRLHTGSTVVSTRVAVE